MKRLLALVLVVLLGCITTNAQNTRKKDALKQARPQTQQQSMLLGKFEKSDLMQEPYSNWFEPRFDEFRPEEQSMEKITDNIGEYEIKILMGTWCGDSKRETPRFFKILELADYDMSKLTAIAVDRSKSTPEKYEEEVGLQKVPTIIFYKNGKEINRFVEFAQESLEKDIAKIVTGEEYNDVYSE